MTNIAVMLYFNGRWDPSNKYINYLADGVLIHTESTFATLVSVIATQLSIDTSTRDMRVIHNSYFSNTFNGIDEAIGLIGFGSCEEVDELEELAPDIIINPNHSLFEKDQKWNNNNRSKARFSGFHLGKKYENILRRNKTALEKLKVVETNKYVYTVLDGITQFTFTGITQLSLRLGNVLLSIFVRLGNLGDAWSLASFLLAYSHNIAANLFRTMSAFTC
uniref:Uncharacterized protein n=1 Tax=Solanum lycopersicum TaxID=4081 RepID=A0A3Q7FLR9_SOLLC